MEIIIVVIAVIVGVMIGRFTHREHPLGVLRVDRSDPASEPLLFLELDTDVYTVMRKKRITFNVKLENFIPHE